MIKKIGLLIFLCLVAISCKEVAKTAQLVLEGDFTKSMTSYDRPQFSGYVKNVGNNTAYNCSIQIKCYSDSGRTTIIDTASGFPSDLGDIRPDERAYFEAVAFNLTSWDQIKATDYTLDWLDR